MNRKSKVIALTIFAATLLGSAKIGIADESSEISASTEKEIKALYKHLIEIENAHDIDALRAIVWKSPSALFVAKTKTPADGNWGAFWGTDAVVEHIGELFRSGTFVMNPDYSREKVVQLSQEVVETYVPLDISVKYAGQSGTPKPFLMIVEWVKDHGEWKMASDIAVPVPPIPAPEQ